MTPPPRFKATTLLVLSIRFAYFRTRFLLRAPFRPHVSVTPCASTMQGVHIDWCRRGFILWIPGTTHGSRKRIHVSWLHSFRHSNFATFCWTFTCDYTRGIREPRP